MKYIDRNSSIITGKNNIEQLYDLKSFPVFIGCTAEPENNDIFEDMTWMICRDSGMIQLKKILPSELIYAEYHSEGLGPTWELHHEEFCKFIEKYAHGDILEIGGSNGALAKKFMNCCQQPPAWTIIEPNPAFRGNEKIKVFKAFFDQTTQIDGIDTIVHSHVLEHLADPNVLLDHIRQLLSGNGRHIFSIPNLHLYLKKKQSNSINFEHTFFLTEYFMDYLLVKWGFDIIEKKPFQEHSIFYATLKKKALSGELFIPNHYEENKRLYLDMIEYFDHEVVRLNDIIDHYDGDLFLFGAHIFSQFLIYRGLHAGKITNILDNSAIKQGKRLYGTSLIVETPKILGAIERPGIIIKAGVYNEEIKRDILENINSNVEIWE